MEKKPKKAGMLLQKEEKKAKPSPQERIAKALLRLSKRLENPVSQTLYDLAQKVLKGEVKVVAPSAGISIGSELKTPFGLGKVVEIVPIEGTKRGWAKVQTPQGVCFVKVNIK